MKCPKCEKTMVFIMSGSTYYGKHHPVRQKKKITTIQQYECKECWGHWLYDRETKKWTMGDLHIDKKPFQPEWRPKEEWKNQRKLSNF